MVDQSTLKVSELVYYTLQYDCPDAIDYEANFIRKY